MHTPFYNDVQGVFESSNPENVVDAASALWNGLYLGGNADGGSSALSFYESRLSVSPDPNVESACSGGGMDSTDTVLCFNVCSLSSSNEVTANGYPSAQLLQVYDQEMRAFTGDGPGGINSRDESISFLIQQSYQQLFEVGLFFLTRLESAFESGTGTPSWLQHLVKFASELNYNNGGGSCSI